VANPEYLWLAPPAGRLNVGGFWGGIFSLLQFGWSSEKYPSPSGRVEQSSSKCSLSGSTRSCKRVASKANPMTRQESGRHRETNIAPDANRTRQFGGFCTPVGSTKSDNPGITIRAEPEHRETRIRRHRSRWPNGPGALRSAGAEMPSECRATPQTPSIF
jgi:hypothetical protein